MSSITFLFNIFIPFFSKLSKESIALLIRHGADPKSQDKNGCTPLHAAVSWHGSTPRRVACLLRKGADPNSTAKDGDTPLHRAAHYGLVTIAKLLLKYGADKKIKNNNGETAIEIAIKSDKCPEDIVDLLQSATHKSS